MIETKPEAATSIWKMGSRLAELCEAAATDAADDIFTKAIQDVPRNVKILIDEVVRLQAKGWDSDVLGPVIFDLVDGDPSRSWEADYSSEYESFKIAALSFDAYVVSHGDWGTVGLDSLRRPEIKLVVGTQEKTDLLSKLQDLANTFPVVGG